MIITLSSAGDRMDGQQVQTTIRGIMLLLVIMISIPFVNAAPTLAGVVAYYPFEGSARDVAGTFDGTISGAVPVTGIRGQAFQFDGVDDYVSLPRSISDDFTIVFWVLTTQTGGTGAQWYRGNGLVDAEIANERDDFGVALLGDGVSFGMGNETARKDTTIVSKSSINDGRWHQVAAVRSMGNAVMSLYIDGNLEATGTSSTSSLDDPPFIGVGNNPCDIDYDREWFAGSIDEIQIYSRVLSADEIRQLRDLATHPDEAGETNALPQSGTEADTDSSLSMFVLLIGILVFSGGLYWFFTNRSRLVKALQIRSQPPESVPGGNLPVINPDTTSKTASKEPVTITVPPAPVQEKPLLRYQVPGILMMIFAVFMLFLTVFSPGQSVYSEGIKGTRELMTDLVIYFLIGLGGWYLYTKGRPKTVIPQAAHAEGISPVQAGPVIQKSPTVNSDNPLPDAEKTDTEIVPRPVISTDNPRQISVVTILFLGILLAWIIAAAYFQLGLVNIPGDGNCDYDHRPAVLVYLENDEVIHDFCFDHFTQYTILNPVQILSLSWDSSFKYYGKIDTKFLAYISTFLWIDLLLYIFIINRRKSVALSVNGKMIRTLLRGVFGGFAFFIGSSLILNCYKLTVLENFIYPEIERSFHISLVMLILAIIVTLLLLNDPAKRAE